MPRRLRIVYVRIRNWPEGSCYKMPKVLRSRYGGKIIMASGAPDLADQLRSIPADLVFVMGDWLDHYTVPLSLGIPYILLQQDVLSMRLDKEKVTVKERRIYFALQREREMIQRAAAVVLTSQYHRNFLARHYRMPATVVVPLGVPRSDIPKKPPRDKTPTKSLVYAGGMVTEERRRTVYGYRCYQRIFSTFMEAGWAVHAYPATGVFASVATDYRRMGVIVHNPVPYPVLLREMGQYTAGLQGYNREGVPNRAFRYAQSCCPNKLREYCAAGIPTIGYNPGKGAAVYIEGGWGIVLEDPTVEGIRAIEPKLPKVTEEMRWSQALEDNLGSLDELVKQIAGRIKMATGQGCSRACYAEGSASAEFQQGGGEMPTQPAKAAPAAATAAWKPPTAPEGKMLLRVLPPVALPYVIRDGVLGSVVFNPDGLISKRRGEALLKTNPKMWEVPTAKPDLKAYPRRPPSAVHADAKKKAK